MDPNLAEEWEVHAVKCHVCKAKEIESKARTENTEGLYFVVDR